MKNVRKVFGWSFIGFLVIYFVNSEFLKISGKDYLSDGFGRRYYFAPDWLQNFLWFIDLPTHIKNPLWYLFDVLVFGVCATGATIMFGEEKSKDKS